MMETGKQEWSPLAIDAAKKSRRRLGPLGMIVGVLVVLAVGLVVFLSTGKSERAPVPVGGGGAGAGSSTGGVAVAVADTNVVLTVSGYVIPRERIEISPRFQGTVQWIGVKKGDRVKAGEVLVRLDDAEQRARLAEADGQVALAEAQREHARAQLARQSELAQRQVESSASLDAAERDVGMAEAQVQVAAGQRALAATYLEWCTIRAPIDGVILEKLVNPNELVTPQSFGDGNGPSTAFLAMADLADLQVEIDLNEADTPRVHLRQACRVVPEAYPDRAYRGYVAELAPEADRAKGTLQVKVQVEQPDAYLTPELTAKVDFLKTDRPVED
jgi:HlyD family secretion protein